MRIKYIRIDVSGGYLKSCRNRLILWFHTALHLNIYRTSLQCVKNHFTSRFSVRKIKCTCLRTVKASIGTITIFTRSSSRSSVRHTDSTTSQTVLGVLAKRQHLAGVALTALRRRLTSCRVRAMGRTAVRNSTENGYGADGSSKRPQARALDFFPCTLNWLVR